MKLSLRQLEYAVAVAERLNFRSAAEACHVSQPGLSSQLQQLETLLDGQLFERNRRRVLLTPAGAALLPRARALLARAEALVEAARGLARPLAGTLRLGVIPTVAPYLLPRVLPEIRRCHPHLRVLLHEDQTARLVADLASGELDLLLLALEADLGDVETLALFEDQFLLALARGHRLARRRVVREADLTGIEVLLLADGHCLRAQALEVCARAGAGESGDLRATSLVTLVQMVASGVGVTLVPAMAVATETARADNLITLPFRRPAPSRTIGLAWRRTSPRAAEYRLLATLLHGYSTPARVGGA